jgi:hypothetical protein
MYVSKGSKSGKELFQISLDKYNEQISLDKMMEAGRKTHTQIFEEKMRIFSFHLPLGGVYYVLHYHPFKWPVGLFLGAHKLAMYDASTKDTL